MSNYSLSVYSMWLVIKRNTQIKMGDPECNHIYVHATRKLHSFLGCLPDWTYVSRIKTVVCIMLMCHLIANINLWCKIKLYNLDEIAFWVGLLTMINLVTPKTALLKLIIFERSKTVPVLFYNKRGMYSTGPFQYRWLKGFIYNSCYYHPIGSIHLSHGYNVFRGCVSEMFVTSYSVAYCINFLGKPGICFYYYCAVYDECK